MKKIGRFLSSMGFAVSLLVLLAAACGLSSLVEQGLTQEVYATQYGDTWASVIMALQVNDAYHSVWFIALSGFLCLNLILCNVIRYPAFLRRYRKAKDASAALKTAGDLGEITAVDPEKVFTALQMKTPVKCIDEEGREALFAQKGRLGIWGAWICHLGVLILIAGFALGQMTQKEIVLWGMPGDTVRIPESKITATIDDFRTEQRDDGSTAQYVTEMTVTDPDSEWTEKVTVSVNHPADFGGYRFYQNNTGWAAAASVTRDGQEIQRKTLVPRQGMEESVLGLNDRPEYAFYFAGVRTMQEEGQEERTLFLYDLYDKGVLRQSYYFFGSGTVMVEEDQVTFTPGRFTLLVGRRDCFTPLALIGGILLMIGLAMAFYLQPKALWAIRDANGQWILRGRCRKGTVLWRERVEEAASSHERSQDVMREEKPDAER